EKFDADGFAGEARRILEWSRRVSDTPEAAALSYEKFMGWFDTHNDTGKKLFDLENEDMRPTNAGSATYFQKMQHHLDPIREQNLDIVIENALAVHDRVLVVYGNGHLVKSRPVFEQAFGGPGVTLQLA